MVLKTVYLYLILLESRRTFWVLNLSLMIVAYYYSIMSNNVITLSIFINLIIIFSVQGLNFKYNNYTNFFLVIYDITKYFVLVKYSTMTLFIMFYLLVGYLISNKLIFIIEIAPFLVLYLINFFINDFRIQRS